MAPATPNGAASHGQNSGSHSAPFLVDDNDSPSPKDSNRRKRSLRSLPGPAPPTGTPTASAIVRKRPAPFDPAELARLKLERHQETRRRQREKYFEILAKETDAMGNLTSAPRKVRTEDDLEKLELKRCFELLHAMGRASDPNATAEATRASIGGFLQAIFANWDTSVDIPVIPGVGAVGVNAPAGRICDCPNEHVHLLACARSHTCKTQVRVCAVYDNQTVTFTYYKVEPKDIKEQKPNMNHKAEGAEADADKEARYQLWLNGSSAEASEPAQGVETPSATANTHMPPATSGDMASEHPTSIPRNETMNFENVRTPRSSETPTFNDDSRIDPLTYPNMKVQEDWREVLKSRLHKALLKRMHEQNKYRALWIVRHMIMDWEKGAGIKVEEDWSGECWGFVRAENIQGMVLALI